MATYYVLIVGFLFILAISLLIIGVSNDAVNFLNSAIGSKAAPFKIILLIAAIGVLIGAVFSNGMMEVARKGIFNPEFFSFSEIMVIFLAVMLTNILILDFFNTVGLPTSTTISIVFGILGAAVAVAMMKVAGAESGTDSIGYYINIESSVLIIVGIFLSIVIAFNICPTTYSPYEGIPVNPERKYFYLPKTIKRGIVPSLMDDILELRWKIQAQMDQAKKDGDDEARGL